MLYKDICKILGVYLFAFACGLFVPLFIDLYYQFIADRQMHPFPFTTLAFIESILFTLVLGSLFYWVGRYSSGNIYRREGLAIVVILWFLTPALASTPFLFSGTLKNPFVAYFEMTSSLTTTGSTALQAKKYDPATGKEIPIEVNVRGVFDTKYSYFGTVNPVVDPETGKVLFEGIEAIGPALLFWRSFVQWFGGIGIVVLFVAIFPLLGVGGRLLALAEVSGPVKESLTPRIKESAVALWKIYVGLTLLEMFFLIVTNSQMPWMDAITISFTTIATGGFSIKNASIGAYQNANTEWVIIVFMFLGSVNFAVYYYAIRAKFYKIYEPEFFVYIILLLLSCTLVSWYLIGGEKVTLTGETGIFTTSEAFRAGFFQVVSAESTTGFTTVDYDRFPYVAQAILLVVMFFGGMSGSTAGGMKIIRLIMLFKVAQYKIESLFRPETVRRLKVGGKEVDTGIAALVLCYFLIITTLSVLGTLLYMFDGVDPETALGLVACMINDTGMSFRAAGPINSCAFLSDFSLFLSSLLMIFGRLEFFAVLALMVPAFWKQNS